MKKRPLPTLDAKPLREPAAVKPYRRVFQQLPPLLALVIAADRRSRKVMFCQNEHIQYLSCERLV